MIEYRKKFAAIFAAVLLFISVIPAAAADSSEDGAPGYLVDFTTQEGVETWEDLAEELDGPVHGMSGKVKWKFHAEEGYTSFMPKSPVGETAESGDTRMTAEMDFSRKEYRFLAICYRINGRISTNHIYLKDDTGNTEYSSKEHTWLYPSFEEDGQWHVMILDLRSSFSGITGRVKGVRIPVTDTEDSSFDVKYIGAFKNKEDAENFDIDKFLGLTDTEEMPLNTQIPATEVPVTTNDSSSNLIAIVIAIAVAAIVVVAVVIAIVFIKRK